MNEQVKRKGAMRKWMLNLHTYIGLLCAPYLLIFGISSLNFNHHFEFAKPSEIKSDWTKTLPHAPKGTNDQQIGDATRDALGMLGWVPWWELKPQSDGSFRMTVEHPGKSYQITLDKEKQSVAVQERSKGFWPVLNSLHGMTGVPNSSISSAWGIYTNICAFGILFASISGVYLWAVSKRERFAGLVAVLLSLAASFGFLIYIVLRG